MIDREDIKKVFSMPIKDIRVFLKNKVKTLGLDKQRLNSNINTLNNKISKIDQIISPFSQSFLLMKEKIFFKHTYILKKEEKIELKNIQKGLMNDYKILTEPFELEELSKINKEIEKNDEKASSWWNNIIEIKKKLFPQNNNKQRRIKTLFEEKASIMIASHLLTQSCQLKEKIL